MRKRSFWTDRRSESLLMGLGSLILSACVHVPPPGAIGASSTNRTVMLYVPGQNGRPGTTLPYSIISSDRKTFSPAEKVKLDASSYLIPGKNQLKEASQSFSVGAPTSVPWKQDVSVIAARPSVVIDAVVKLLKRGVPVTVENIQAELGPAVLSEKASSVVTGIVSEPYLCRNGGDFVPMDLLRNTCAHRAVIEKVSISSPGLLFVGKLKNLPSSYDRQFWYTLSQFEQAVQSHDLAVADVTPLYNLAWGGHMPRMQREYQIKSIPVRLAVAEAEATSDDITEIKIYQPSKS